jgi:hypothetical protein
MGLDPLGKHPESTPKESRGTGMMATAFGQLASMLQGCKLVAGII